MKLDPRLASGELGDNALILGLEVLGFFLFLYLAEWVITRLGKNRRIGRKDW